MKVTPKSIITDRQENRWLLVSRVEGDKVYMVDHKGRNVEGTMDQFELHQYDSSKRFMIKDNYTNE